MPLIAGGQRSRAHKTHLAARHVPKLRQLIQKNTTHKTSRPRHSRIIIQLEHPSAAFSSILKAVVQSFRFMNHGAELEQDERPSAVSVAHLTEQHRKSVSKKHQQRK